MNELIDLAVRVLSHVPLDTLLQALAAAGVLGVILQKVKKWFEVQSNGVINFINLLLSGAVVMIQGLVSASAQNPSLIPSKALGLMSLVILFYHTPYVGIKALSDLSTEVKSRREQKVRLAAKNAAAADVPEVDIESVVPQVPVADVPVAVSPVTSAQFAPVE
jgi:hypothetical protein